MISRSFLLTKWKLNFSMNCRFTKWWKLSTNLWSSTERSGTSKRVRQDTWPRWPSVALPYPSSYRISRATNGRDRCIYLFIQWNEIFQHNLRSIYTLYRLKMKKRLDYKQCCCNKLFISHEYYKQINWVGGLHVVTVNASHHNKNYTGVSGLYS